MPDIASFHDVRFPTAVSFGATGGPERRTEIVRLASGREKRNQRTARSRRRFDAGTGLRSIADLEDVLAFFEARRGQLTGFRFRDPFDWKSCRTGEAVSPLDQEIGTGDGARTTFQLAKTYGVGDDAYLRPVRRPVAGSIRVVVGGVEAPGTGFTVDTSSGIVTFTVAPAAAAAVTAGFEFDVAARFDTDTIQASLSAFKAGQIPSLPIVEIIEDE